MKATVYYSKIITPERVLALYAATGAALPGRVAVKVHSGEGGNQNFLRPAFLKPMVERVHGTVVECNTAYPGTRNTTKKHLALLREHGWLDCGPVCLMDGEGPDLRVPIRDGLVLRENLLGRALADFDSMLVLSHFKGHPMGGYGGALKQLSIGCASAAGKCLIHSGGVVEDPRTVWGHTAEQDVFCDAMADAAKCVVDYLHGALAYVNVMTRLSVDCDCCAEAEEPCMADLGILSSLDPVALDQACLDLVYASDDPGKAQLIERVESRHGRRTIASAARLGLGSREYTLRSLD